MPWAADGLEGLNLTGDQEGDLRAPLEDVYGVGARRKLLLLERGRFPTVQTGMSEEDKDVALLPMPPGTVTEGRLDEENEVVLVPNPSAAVTLGTLEVERDEFLKGYPPGPVVALEILEEEIGFEPPRNRLASATLEDEKDVVLAGNPPAEATRPIRFASSHDALRPMACAGGML